VFVLRKSIVPRLAWPHVFLRSAVVDDDASMQRRQYCDYKRDLSIS
jgi:hypothetical protein